LPGLVIALLVHERPGARAEDPPRPAPGAEPPKVSEYSWTFAEARERLTLSHRDPYLQYVVLQLGRREGREKEAFEAVERPSLLGRLGLFGGGGRGSRADLFATFTGALALQESLQLDTMRGEAPGGAVPRPPGVPDPNPPQPKQPKVPEKVAVSKLTGPTVPSHPWEKMLGGKKPEVGPLAGCVPEEFYFAEFRSVARLHEVLGIGQLWSGHIFTQALGGARSQQTAERIKKQLGLSGLAPETLDRLGIEAVAVTGSDPFLSEGSDITLLVHGRNVGGLATLADAVKTAPAKKGEHVGIAYTYRSTADGAVNVYAASPRPELHVRGNSLPAFKMVLEAIAGKTAEGKPVRRLGESAEFRYVRTRMLRGADEDGFVYLSDSFIRRLTGPQLKLTERRRVLVYNHLRMIGHAALLFRTEHGRAPKSLEELAEAKCAPGVFGRGDLAHPDGGTYSLSADGMSGVCSRYGRVENLTPCIERLVTEVSGSEAEEYKQFVADYAQYWRTFFDPIAIRVTVAARQYRLETLVLPLIDNSIYTELARGAGKPAPMDLLPTPKREIGGLWIHLPKKELLDALGPEQPPKQPGPNDPARPVAPEVRPKAPFEITNDLRQIGLAINSYHDTHAQLPTTNIRDKNGKPLLSWRVAILPYIEQNDLYKQFKLDEPWDSEHNKKLIGKMPRTYSGADEKLNAAGKTAYLVPSGKNTLSPPDGAKLTLAGITDGTSNTLLMMVADPERSVVWTRPDDLPFDPKEPLKGVIRPGVEGIDVVMVDGSTKRFSPGIDPKKFAALITPAGGETVTFEPGDELAQPGGSGSLEFLRGFRLGPQDWRQMEDAGFDLNKLRRFLRDGIGDQIGFHMHDAPRLLDSDLSGLFGDGEEAALSSIGLLVRFVFGASSVSIPVKDPKVVDEYLEELDRVILAGLRDVKKTGLIVREVDFYRVPFPKPHTIRCLVGNFAGVKVRLYWGRIGDGLYIATRPFILEDIAGAHAEGKKPVKTEPAHAVLRIRPENWQAVLPGYNLGWAEANRGACRANLDMLANVNRGWNDRRPAAGAPSAELLAHVGRVYGERPFCPDGGTYDLSADGRACRCSVHGGHDDPRQPAAPTAASPTGRLLKSFAGLTATVRFEEDGLRVIVTVTRNE
jgi:hypothetical protein